MFKKAIALFLVLALSLGALSCGALAGGNEVLAASQEPENFAVAQADTEEVAGEELPAESTESETEAFAAEPADDDPDAVQTEEAAESGQEEVPADASNSPLTDGATEEVAAQEEMLSRIVVNPAYSGGTLEEDIQVLMDARPAAGEKDASQSVYYATSYSSVEDAGNYLREQIKARTTNYISLTYTFRGSMSQSAASDLADSIMYAAVAHTGVPDEGDYLAFSMGGFGWQIYKSGNTLTIYYTVMYLTTAAQEQEFSARVDALLASLQLDGKDDYEKVCAIYDYICENVVYDEEHLFYYEYFGIDYPKMFTAYGALIEGAAVCQGYAALFYRLALECGVDCRIVTSEAHAWNIVKMGSYYYNVDTTWDAGASEYSWFLCSDAAFYQNPYHIRESYNLLNGVDASSAAYYQQYPIGPTNFSLYLDATGVAGDIDGDGVVNIADVQALLKKVNRQVVSVVQEAMDVSGDEIVDITDVQLLLKYVNGQDVALQEI